MRDAPAQHTEVRQQSTSVLVAGSRFVHERQLVAVGVAKSRSLLMLAQKVEFDGEVGDGRSEGDGVAVVLEMVRGSHHEDFLELDTGQRMLIRQPACFRPLAKLVHTLASCMVLFSPPSACSAAHDCRE